MKLKDLEKMINKKMEEHKDEEKEFSYISDDVEEVVRDIFKEDKDLYVTSGYGCKGNIEIKMSGEWGHTITIKVRRKKAGTEYQRFYGYVTKYKFDRVEIPDYYDFDSIEGFKKMVKESLQKKEDYKKEKIETFKKGLDENGISFEDFRELMKLYQGMDYESKREVVISYVGEEDYYKYV